jgi:MFS family permease
VEHAPAGPGRLPAGGAQRRRARRVVGARRLSAAVSRALEPEPQPDTRAFFWFCACIASWFAAWGIQMVMFSWLIVGELDAGAEWLGLAQTSTMLPALFLVLFGGAAADRVDPRRLIAGVHVLAVLPVLALALTLAGGRLTLVGLGVYGVAIGTLSAFGMPARDTLLSRVAGRDLMRAVTTLTAVQFGAQSAGNLFAGSARWWGPLPVMAVQALLLAGGAVAIRRVAADAPPARAPGRGSALREIADGVAVVASTPRLRTPLGMVLAVSVLFIGPFTVAVPLLVRDVYAGGAAEISLIFTCFPVGTIAGSLVLRARGLRRKGFAVLAALALCCGALALMGLGLPLPLMMLTTFVWGLGGAVFINASRTLYQAAAPIERRARVMAVYQLAFLGGAPFGSLAGGVVGAAIGPERLLFACAGAMLVVLAGTALGTGMAQME